MAHVSGSLYPADGKSTVSKTNRTSLGASLTYISGTHLEEDVTVDIGMAVSGDFEVSLRVKGQARRISLSKGNVRRLAAELRRVESKGGALSV